MTPSPPRSIPSAVLEKIALPRIALPAPAAASTSTPMPAPTPTPVLSAIVLPAPAAVPPIVLFDEPPWMRMPVSLPSGWAPLMSVPIRLPSTSSSWSPRMSPRPAPALPEITLPAVADVPPIVTSSIRLRTTPYVPLPRALVAVLSVPMKLPWIRPPTLALPNIRTPAWALAEMTLPAPAAVPPIVLPVAPAMTTMPFALPTGTVPVASLPIRLPSTRLSDTSQIQIPCPTFEIRFP